MSSRPAVRQLGRLSEISQVAAKHGFGYFFDTHRPHGMRSRRAREVDISADGSNRGLRVRQMLDELGPTFVKFGQLLSTRPDIVPPDIVFELQGAPGRCHAGRVLRGRTRHPGGAGADRRAALPRLRGGAGRGSVDRPGAPGDAPQRATRRGKGAAAGRAEADRGRSRADVPGGAPRPRPREGARVHRRRLARRRVRADDPTGARLPDGGAQRRAVPPQLRRASARARPARLLELLALACAHARAPRGRPASGPRSPTRTPSRSGGGSPT